MHLKLVAGAEALNKNNSDTVFAALYSSDLINDQRSLIKSVTSIISYDHLIMPYNKLSHVYKLN